MSDQPGVFVSPLVDWWALAPQIILLSVALFVLLATALVRRPVATGFSTVLTMAAGAAIVVVGLILWADVQNNGARTTLNDAFGIDGFSLFFTVLIGLGVFGTALVSHDYVKRHQLVAPELAGLLLISAAGAIVMASANDLIVLFLGLETLSIALYVMIALHLRREDSRESAIKYFVLGALSSAFFLYGIALVYGATGTTNLSEIGAFLNTYVLLDEQLLLAGIALLLVGLAFKIAAAPFHMWAPDVYQGAPSPIAGYLASIVKAAGFAALMRVLFVGFGQHTVSWTPVLIGLTFATLAVGAVLAIRQNDVKRMLAFSSISHAGFALIGVQAASEQGAAAALFYLFTYSFITLGSFAVLALMSTPVERPAQYQQASSQNAWSRHDLSNFTGLARQHPVLTLTFTVLLLAQAGVPLTSGFIGKFQVIAAAVNEGGYVLAVVAMLTAVVSAFAYLRVVLAMYTTTDEGNEAGVSETVSETGSTSEADSASVLPTQVPLTACLALFGFVGITLVAGVVPQFLIDFTTDAVSLFSFS